MSISTTILNRSVLASYRPVQGLALTALFFAVLAASLAIGSGVALGQCLA